MTYRIFSATALLAALTSGAAGAAPVQWVGNGHWYELIIDDLQTTFSGALGAAAARTWMGDDGYLATITSGLEQAFLDAVNPNGYTAWLGGGDRRVEADWRWLNGPEAGEVFTYTNWSAGEPNNCCGGEHGLLGWWSGNQWNDIYDGAGAYAYVVEYGAAPSTVPLPAGLPLLGFGLGAFGLVALRRRSV